MATVKRWVLLTAVMGVAVSAALGVRLAWVGLQGTEGATPPLRIPEEEARRRNPVPATPESLERGARLFGSQCAMCHGERGDGSGDLARSLDIRVPDLSDPETLRKRTDGELFWVLTHGRGKMPGEGERLSDAFKWDLIHHVRTLPRPRP